jgi:hypothetical protein
LNSQRDEIISYFQNDISDTISSWATLNRGLKSDFPIS